MASAPLIVHRPSQPYVGLAMTVTMATFGPAIDAGFPELFAWLAERNLMRAGAPFIRYHVIDMSTTMRVELGVPVTVPTAGDTRIRSDVLPEGRYATIVHAGPYDGLMAANAELQEWAEVQGVRFDMQPDTAGDRWRGRIEHYLTDPAHEPDPTSWRTEIAYLLAE